VVRFGRLTGHSLSTEPARSRGRGLLADEPFPVEGLVQTDTIRQPSEQLARQGRPGSREPGQADVSGKHPGEISRGQYVHEVARRQQAAEFALGARSVFPLLRAVTPGAGRT